MSRNFHPTDFHGREMRNGVMVRSSSGWVLVSTVEGVERNSWIGFHAPDEEIISYCQQHDIPFRILHARRQ